MEESVGGQAVWNRSIERENIGVTKYVLDGERGLSGYGNSGILNSDGFAEGVENKVGIAELLLET